MRYFTRRKEAVQNELKKQYMMGVLWNCEVYYKSEVINDNSKQNQNIETKNVLIK